MKRLFTTIALAAAATLSAHAATVNIDLSGAVTGTTVTGTHATFAQSFAGQTVSGISLTGSPTNPLTLQAVGTIGVAAFNPGVSAASNSLLSQPGNSAPLAMLFDSDADSFTWTMGSSDAGSTVLASFYGVNGALVGSSTVVMGNGYNVYSLSGLGTFRGIAFSNNNDGGGVRFQNMSFNSVTSAVPEPGALALVGLGLLAAGATRRRATPIVTA